MAQAIIDSLPRKEFENYDRDMRKEKAFKIDEVDEVTQSDLIKWAKKEKRNVSSAFQILFGARVWEL